jgi:hypothetical protein
MTDLFSPAQDPIWNVMIRFGVTLLVLFIVIRKIALTKGNAELDLYFRNNDDASS